MITQDDLKTVNEINRKLKRVNELIDGNVDPYYGAINIQEGERDLLIAERHDLEKQLKSIKE